MVGPRGNNSAHCAACVWLSLVGVAGTIGSSLVGAVLSRPTEYAEARLLSGTDSCELIWSTWTTTRVVTTFPADFDEYVPYFDELIQSWWDADEADIRDGKIEVPHELGAAIDRYEDFREGRCFDDPPIRGGGARPRWYRPSVGYDEAEAALWSVQVVEASGWPFRAFVSEVRIAALSERSPFYQVDVRGGVVVVDIRDYINRPDRDWDRQYWGDLVVIPYRILPFGLVANTVCWAIICWLVMAGTSIARGTVRRRLGLCRCCGYRLKGVESSYCPECGVVLFKNHVTDQVERTE